MEFEMPLLCHLQSETGPQIGFYDLHSQRSQASGLVSLD